MKRNSSASAQSSPALCALWRAAFLVSVSSAALLAQGQQAAGAEIGASPAAAATTPAPVGLPPIAPGPFGTSDESLKQYQYPEWFRDAKFGMWSHWGPQAVPRHGDWYAKKLYVQDNVDKKTGEHKGPDADYADHLARYGHPSKAGYKDIIPLWKAERWDPEKLMALYKKAGARYFFSMGSHHDNFFLWNSRIHRWNAVRMGPMKDIVGLWQQAARKEGLKFGVSEHLAASYTWFQTSHGADASGPLAGVPYDGNDPANEDLYHSKADPGDTGWLTKNPVWHQEWFADVKELIDLYHPDLLYSDSGLPFGEVGRSMLAHYYNQSAARDGGTANVVYNCKEASHGRFVRDIERGVTDEISPEPWQSDTSIGDWFYRTGQRYKSADEVVHLLVDIVSKNGNLLLNVVQAPEGDLEPDVLTILDGIAAWTAANGEGIYATRPWKVFGERPPGAEAVQTGMFNEGKVKFTAEDIRFTTSKDGRQLYAFCLGVPTADVRIKSLGADAKLAGSPVATVELLGSTETVQWKQEAGALVITPPRSAPSPAALGYKIRFR